MEMKIGVIKGDGIGPEIVDEAMKAVHAEDLGNSDYNAISDGQKQRVLLERAI